MSKHEDGGKRQERLVFESRKNPGKLLQMKLTRIC